MMQFNLGKALDSLGISMNKLSILSEVRPNTVNDLVNGKTKRIEIETIMKILDSLNQFAVHKGIKKQFKINDIIEYVPEGGFHTEENDKKLMTTETFHKLKELLSKHYVQSGITELGETNALEVISLYENFLAESVYYPLDRSVDKRYKEVNTLLLKLETLLNVYGLIEIIPNLGGAYRFRLNEKGLYFTELLKNENA